MIAYFPSHQQRAMPHPMLRPWLSLCLSGLLVGAALAAPGAHAQPAAAETTDRDPPRLINLAIAADNPAAAPVITAQVGDDVERVIAHWRVGSEPWQELPLAGDGTVRIGRLPDGPQRTGFSVWIELRDAAGNVTRVASEAEPMEVAAAVESNTVRIQREAAAASPGVHPALLLLAFGVGIGGVGGAGIFGYDLNVVQGRLADVEAQLHAGGLSAERETQLVAERDELRKAQTQDLAVAITLGVIGVTALVTGGALLAASALE